MLQLERTALTPFAKEHPAAAAALLLAVSRDLAQRVRVTSVGLATAGDAPGALKFEPRMAPRERSLFGKLLAGLFGAGGEA